MASVVLGRYMYEINGVERGQRDLEIVLRLNRVGMLRLHWDKNATREEWMGTWIVVAR